MQYSQIDVRLDALELQLKKMGEALVSGGPTLVGSVGATFQQLAVEFIQVVDEVGRTQLASHDRVQKIKALANGLAGLRESLLRRSAYVDRALEILVPATQQKTTYAGSGTYGKTVRNSGAFTSLSA